MSFFIYKNDRMEKNGGQVQFITKLVVEQNKNNRKRERAKKSKGGKKHV